MLRKEGRVYLGLYFQGTVYHDGEVVVSHCMYGHQAEWYSALFPSAHVVVLLIVKVGLPVLGNLI